MTCDLKLLISTVNDFISDSLECCWEFWPLSPCPIYARSAGRRYSHQAN
jgi:hypothetical protein